jgi:hypothetical protein
MPAEFDQIAPEMGQDPAMDQANMGSQPEEHIEIPPGEEDRQGAMAKADLYKLANYSHKLFKQIHEDDQLESWVQAKITKAADYIASVYHYLEYEMKFTEYGHHLDNSDTLSEGQKSILRDRLMEARKAVALIKIEQASKMSEATKTDKPWKDMSGKTHAGTAVKGDKYTGKEAEKEAKGKEKDVKEAAEKTPSTWTDSKGNKHPATKVKGDKYTGKEAEKETKTPKKDELDEGMMEPCSACGGAGHVAKAHVRDRAHPNVVAKAEAYHQKNIATAAAMKRMKVGTEPKDKIATEALKGGQKKLDKNHNNKLDGEDFKMLRGEKKVAETKEKCNNTAKGKSCPVHGLKECDYTMEGSKPSAGLSAAKKSAVVKKAKAGGDIGKPGKSFDKVAKSAGGGEKGKKIAAAAMWKNIKETVAYIEEKKKIADKNDGNLANNAKPYDKVTQGDVIAGRLGKDEQGGKKKETVKESADMSRMRELTGRLNRSETASTLTENSEVNQIRALTQRLLG